MADNLNINVAAIDAQQRRVLEEVIGRPLKGNQRLVISVIDEPGAPVSSESPQTIEDWIHIYDGLSDEQVEEIDRIAKTRARLTRTPG